MAPEQHPKATRDGTQKKPWEPPRGIRYEHRADRPKKPFYLHWRDSKGVRKKQGFKTEKDRETIARELAAKKEEHGTAILDFDPVKWRTWLEFERMVGADTDPLRVASEWLAAREGTGQTAKSSTPVKEAWEIVRALRKKEERLSEDTWRHIDTHVGKRFVGHFGKDCLHTLNAKGIRAWLDGLTNSRNGKPMEEQTKLHHLNDVSAFMELCVREGMIEKNPCEHVARPDVEGDGDVIVLPVRDAFEFFKANRNNPAAIRVAMEAFGALRYRTAALVGHANINFEERGIEMPGAIHKSTKRRFRQGHPDCLWAWLDLAMDAQHATWTLNLRQYAEAKRIMLTNANLRPFVAVTDADREKLKGLRNIWRHSCASYLLAKTKSFPTVQYLMQHKHATTTEIYEGQATERDAHLFLCITPDAVLLSWEEFAAKFALKPEDKKEAKSAA